MRHPWFMLLVPGVILMFSQSSATAQERSSGGKPKTFAIALHGGAGSNPDNWTDEKREARIESLGKALDIGVAVLKEGGTSLDAVERVIRHLEDDPLFNAGRGAVFNAAGGHELDASIMDGETRACGAVAGVRTVKNPIGLARLVMKETRHVLLAGDGAETFADTMKVDREEQSYFHTEEQLRAWESQRKGASDNAAKGTVGCVALDTHGHLAAGTSTGGLTNKMFGRVGDSPIVGAGTYADDATCAVSGTGIGEQYIRNAAAYDVSARMAYLKQPLDEAVQAIIEGTLNQGDGGLIAVDYLGNISMRYNTPGMSHAAANAKGYRVVALK